MFSLTLKVTLRTLRRFFFPLSFLVDVFIIFSTIEKKKKERKRKKRSVLIFVSCTLSIDRSESIPLVMIGGVCTPCVVHACSIRNQSNDSVYVRVLYEIIQGSNDDTFERRLEFQLGSNRQIHIDEELFDKGSFQIRQTIRSIEVTRPNGNVQHIDAPFENVQGIELDWLFIIDNRSIQSINN